MQKPSLLGQFIFYVLMAVAAFMSCVSFLGFVGWFSHPSNQKWAALGCCVFGAAASFVFWNMKDEFFYPKLEPHSDKIENRPVPEQRRYWRNCIYSNLSIGVIGSLILWLSPPLFGQSRHTVQLPIVYIAVLVAYWLLLSAFKLLKLRDR